MPVKTRITNKEHSVCPPDQMPPATSIHGLLGSAQKCCPVSMSVGLASPSTPVASSPATASTGTPPTAPTAFMGMT